MITEQKNTNNEDIKKKTPKPLLEDLDDFIFKDEEIKYQSER